MARTLQEMQALLRLLDEPETSHVRLIKQQLQRWPAEDLEALRDLCLEEGEARNHIRSVLEGLKFDSLEARWLQICRLSRVDLESALLVVAQTGPTGFDETEVHSRLSALARRVGERLAGDRAFDTGLDALAAVLHGEEGLRGNAADYYNPENSYLPSVLRRRLGIPISLSSITIIVGQKLDLPICGIGTPGHFLCFYGDISVPSGTFVDPFGGFARLSRAGIEDMIREGGHRPEPWMFAPVNEREIVARTLRNLIALHRTQGRPAQADRLLRWLESLISHGRD